MPILKTTTQNFLKTLYNYNLRNVFKDRGVGSSEELALAAHVSASMSKTFIEKNENLKKLQALFEKNYKNNPMLIYLESVSGEEETIRHNNIFFKCYFFDFKMQFFIKLNESESLFLTPTNTVLFPVFYSNYVLGGGYTKYSKQQIKEKKFHMAKKLAEKLATREERFKRDFKLISIKIPTTIFEYLSKNQDITLENFLETIKKFIEKSKENIISFLIENKEDFIELLAKRISINVLSLSLSIKNYIPYSHIIFKDYEKHRTHFLKDLERKIFDAINRETQNIMGEEIKKLTISNSSMLRAILDDTFREIYKRLNLEKVISEHLLKDIVDFCFEYYQLNDYKKYISEFYEQLKEERNDIYFLTNLLDNAYFELFEKNLRNTIIAITKVSDLLISILQKEFLREIESYNSVLYLNSFKNTAFKYFLEELENILGKEKILEEIIAALDKIFQEPTEDTTEKVVKKGIEDAVNYVIPIIIRKIKEKVINDLIQHYTEIINYTE